MFKRIWRWGRRRRPALDHTTLTSADTKELLRQTSIPNGVDYTVKLNEKILTRIFEFVCPHSTDESYETSEKSKIGDRCMLCDTRDLANCAQVRRSWSGAVQRVLYKSVRIDAVHYCEREESLVKHRRSRHRGDYDPAIERLGLFGRTVKNSDVPRATVELLKVQYTALQNCQNELARIVSVLPNLRYVDLPEQFFSQPKRFPTLLPELSINCKQLRKMRYDAGSESFFTQLPTLAWKSIEVLQLKGLKIEPVTLRETLGCLCKLRDLKITESPSLNDSMFDVAPNVCDFPALERLTLEEMPNVTANGLRTYLGDSQRAEYLQHLSLTNTGVAVDELHGVLAAATHLRELAISGLVRASLPVHTRLPPLQSPVLRTLHFEISSEETAYQLVQPPHSSYYAYLVSSLHTNSLPNLQDLYVRDLNFAETLALLPPMPNYASDVTTSVAKGLSYPLKIYAKSMDEHGWILSEYQPSDGFGRRASFSVGRPLSAIDASHGLGPQWGSQSRNSSIVGNGFGGFVAIPTEPPQSPKMRNGRGYFGGDKKRASRADLWR